MRGWIVVAACTLALGAMPLLAQHGGGHASGGHAGFASHAGGAGGHSSGMRSAPGTQSRSFSSSHQFSSYPRSSGRFVGPRAGTFGGNCFGCRRRGYGYPYPYAGFYDPSWWWESGSSYDDDRARELAEADQMNQESLEEQSMRQDGDQDLYSDWNPRQVRRPEPPTPDTTPATVLVFHDQKKQEIRNYAIVGQTLWSFAGQRTERIPLSALDLEATAEANEDRGVDFHLPVAPAGQ